MIQIGMTRQDTRHPDKRRRHPGRAGCEVAGQRMVTLLWLHGHGGKTFEVHDDRSPSGGPGPGSSRSKKWPTSLFSI